MPGGGGGGVTPIDSASSHYHDNRPWTCHTISGPPGPSVAEYLVPGGQPQGPCMAAIIDLGNRFCGGTIHGVAVIPIDSVVTTATAVNSQSRSKGCGQRSKLAQKYGQRWSQCGMIARKQSALEHNLDRVASFGKSLSTIGGKTCRAVKGQKPKISMVI